MQNVCGIGELIKNASFRRFGATQPHLRKSFKATTQSLVQSLITMLEAGGHCHWIEVDLFFKRPFQLPDIPLDFTSLLLSVSTAISNTISPQRHENSVFGNMLLGLCACTKHRRDGPQRAASFARKPRADPDLSC